MSLSIGSVDWLLELSKVNRKMLEKFYTIVVLVEVIGFI